MSAEPSTGYDVTVPEGTAIQFRTLLRRAGRSGNGRRVVDAMQRIHDRLVRQPLQVGELLYTLRKTRLQIRAIALDPVYVEFGIRPDDKSVVVRHIAGMGRLGDPPG